jgi:hypothetical protein
MVFILMAALMSRSKGQFLPFARNQNMTNPVKQNTRYDPRHCCGGQRLKGIGKYFGWRGSMVMRIVVGYAK